MQRLKEMRQAQERLSEYDPMFPGDLPGLHGLTVRVVEVTPQLATKWLEMNLHNRSPKNAKQEQYARDMESCAWRLTAEPIVFDAHGVLRNGQNRLMACIKAGRSFTTLVVWGVHPEAFKAMDRGAVRSASDIFQIEGEKETTALAGALGYLWRYTQGVSLVGGGKTTPTIAEQEALLEQHPKIRDSVRVRLGLGRLGFPSPALGICLHYLFWLKDPDKADRFFDALLTGEGLSAGNPVHTLREQLIRTKSNRDREGRVGVSRAAAWTILAWNAYVRGGRRTVLKYHPEDGLPAIEGPK